MHAFDLKVPPVALIAVVAVLMWAASTVVSTATFFLPGASIIAFALALMGIGVVIAGVFAFKRHHTTVNPMKPETTTTIVTAGIYRFTRNPMYLGMALVLLGWAIYLANLAALLLAPAFAAYMTRFQIQPEERALQDKFGSNFTEYMVTVRRWI